MTLTICYEVVGLTTVVTYQDEGGQDTAAGFRKMRWMKVAWEASYK